MKFLRFALFLFLLLPLAHSLEPKMAGKATIIANLSWTVDSGYQDLNSMTVKTFGFKNYPSQKVISESSSLPFDEETDAFGNRILKFKLDPSKRAQSFSLLSEVSVEFPFSFLPAADTSKYLKESPKVIITPEIKSMAEQVIAGKNSDWEKAAALAEWVHNSVEYDFSYISVSKDSVSVYSERRGTCDEFSHLLIAMLRSVGIPAKFSAAFVYSGKEWGAHAFVEAAIDGKWIPIDPTFNEMVLLDATHVKFGEGYDQEDIKEDILISGIGASAQDVKLDRFSDLQVKSSENFPNLFDVELVLPEKAVGEGSIEKVMAKVKNGAEKIAVPLSLNMPKELKTVGTELANSDKLLLLEPFEEKTAEWKVLFPKNMEQGIIYRFPIEVSTLGMKINGSMEGRKGAESRLEESMSISLLAPKRDGSNLNIRFKIKNVGNVALKNVEMIFKTEGKTRGREVVNFEVGEEKETGFSIIYPEEQGELKGEVSIATGNATISQPFTITLESGNPSSSVSTNANAPSGQSTGFDMPILAGTVVLLLIFLFLLLKRK